MQQSWNTYIFIEQLTQVEVFNSQITVVILLELDIHHSYIISQLPHTIRMIMAEYCTDGSNFGGAGAQNVFNSRYRKKCSKLTTFFGLHTTNTGCGNQDLHYKVS